MRKITKEAVTAFLNGVPYKKSNTEVKIIDDKRKQLILFGWTIAFTDSNGLYISDCGYRTMTTKERLNGLLRELGITGIWQKTIDGYKHWYWADGVELPKNKFVRVGGIK